MCFFFCAILKPHLVEPSITAPDAITSYLVQSFNSYNWIHDQYKDRATLSLVSTKYGFFFTCAHFNILELSISIALKPQEPTPTPATKRGVTDCTQFASSLAVDLMNQTFAILPKYVKFEFLFW